VDALRLFDIFGIATQGRDHVAAAREAEIGGVRREFLMGGAIPLFFGFQRN
jgi:hypothetical protein